MKKLFCLVLFFFFYLSVFSSHYIGGEITWECNKDPLSLDYGKYTFYLTIYQDCDGIDFSTIGYDITVHNHPSLFSINLPFSSAVDISPTELLVQFHVTIVILNQLIHLGLLSNGIMYLHQQLLQVLLPLADGILHGELVVEVKQLLIYQMQIVKIGQ